MSTGTQDGWKTGVMNALGARPRRERHVGPPPPVDVHAMQQLSQQVAVLNRKASMLCSAAEALIPRIGAAVQKSDETTLTEGVEAMGRWVSTLATLEADGIREYEGCLRSCAALDIFEKEIARTSKLAEDKLELIDAARKAEAKLVSIALPAAKAIQALHVAGGVKPENTKLEDAVLRFGLDYGKNREQLAEDADFPMRYPKQARALVLLERQVKAINEARSARARADAEVRSGLATLTDAFSRSSKSPEKLVADEVKQEMRDDLAKLEAAQEDVSGKRCGFTTKDKGFKALVVDPVNELLPELRRLMERGQVIDNTTCPQAAQLLTALQIAQGTYELKLDAEDKKKKPSDSKKAHLTKKINAVKSRIEGLMGFIAKVNNKANLVAGKMAAMKEASLRELEEAGGVAKVQALADSLARGAAADTGDEAADKAAKSQAKADANTLADFLMKCDPFQLDAILGSGIPADVMGVVFASMGVSRSSVSTVFTQEFLAANAGKNAYIQQVVEAAIQQGFDSAGDGTKALRSNSNGTNLTKEYAVAAGGADFCDEVCVELGELIGGQELTTIKPPSQSGLTVEQYERATAEHKLALQRDVPKYEALLRQLFKKVTAKKPPSAITKTSVKLYDAALGKYGTVDEARKYVGGFIFLRLVNPTIVTSKVFKKKEDRVVVIAISKALQSLANNTTVINDKNAKFFESVVGELRGAMDVYTDYVVNLGRAENAGFDAIDYAEQTLRSNSAIRMVFQPPSADDPLGTLAADPSSVLGHEINLARQQRSTDYDFVPPMDPVVVQGERKEVLNIVLSGMT